MLSVLALSVKSVQILCKFFLFCFYLLCSVFISTFINERTQRTERTKSPLPPCRLPLPSHSQQEEEKKKIEKQGGVPSRISWNQYHCPHSRGVSFLSIYIKSLSRTMTPQNRGAPFYKVVTLYVLYDENPRL